MRKLDRNAVAAPSCLSAYDYRTLSWGDFGAACKRSVRFALFQLQGIHGITSEDASEYGLRCAYCESAIRHEGHIEHFRRKNRTRPDGYPELTFSWDNLFLACGSKNHCGHYKDRRNSIPYDADQILKPDVDEPEDFLYFHSSGEVRPRHNLEAADEHRARETIRVFGLNDRGLKGSRANAVASYRKRLESDIAEITSWEEDLRREYLLCEIDVARWEPYATTVKHFFLRSSR
jgi:uncharacterized protein (TIGR02646 family)